VRRLQERSRYDTLQKKDHAPMQPVTAAKVKYGIWGLIFGAVIVMIVGFVWGGWTTSGTAKTMTTEAVLASRSAICVAQFMKQPDHEEKLKEFQGLSRWGRKRAEFITKGGWDKMPGQEDAGPAVAGACVDGLELLAEK
jgi:hypothetical protein